MSRKNFTVTALAELMAMREQLKAGVLRLRDIDAVIFRLKALNHEQRRNQPQ